eukprot:symbB.v1.2.011586.t1/scaffold771.1/size163808/6
MAGSPKRPREETTVAASSPQGAKRFKAEPSHPVLPAPAAQAWLEEVATTALSQASRPMESAPVPKQTKTATMKLKTQPSVAEKLDQLKAVGIKLTSPALREVAAATTKVACVVLQALMSKRKSRPDEVANPSDWVIASLAAKAEEVTDYFVPDHFSTQIAGSPGTYKNLYIARFHQIRKCIDFCSAMSLGYAGREPFKASMPGLTAYEKKMMKRLEQANLRAQVPKQEPPREKPKAPEPGNPDHERLIELARESRQQGNLFYYFPEANERLKQQAREVHEQMKDREALDENLRLRNEDHPERGIADFFEELEELQQKERRARTTQERDAEPQDVVDKKPQATMAAPQRGEGPNSRIQADR